MNEIQIPATELQPGMELLTPGGSDYLMMMVSRTEANNVFVMAEPVDPEGSATRNSRSNPTS